MTMKSKFSNSSASLPSDIEENKKNKRKRDKATLSLCNNQRNRPSHRKTRSKFKIKPVFKALADPVIGVPVPRKLRTIVIKRWNDESDSNTKRVAEENRQASLSMEMTETEHEVADVLLGLKTHILSTSSSNSVDGAKLKKVTVGEGLKMSVGELGKQDEVQNKDGLVKGSTSSASKGKVKFDVDLNGMALESTTINNVVEMEMEESDENKDWRINGKGKFTAFEEHMLSNLNRNRAQFNSLPFALNDWPSGFAPAGYMTPFPTARPTGGTNHTSTPYQHLPWQTQRKRCATHKYIAQNIFLHQKSTQRQNFWPSTLPSVGNMIFGTPPHVYSSNLNVNHLQNNSHFAENSSNHNKNDRSYDNNSENGNRLVLQQAKQPSPAGDALCRPAYIFHPNPHQVTVPSGMNQTAHSRSATSPMNSLPFSNTASNAPTISSPPPAATGSVGLIYPMMSTKEAQFFTILPNNGYSFPVAIGVGMPPTLMGTPQQPFSFFSGPMPQVFNQSQCQEQRRHHSIILPGQPDTSKSNPSSLFKKETSVQQQKTTENSSSGLFISNNMHFEHPQKGCLEPLSSKSHKSGVETNVENVSTVAGNGTSQVQNNDWSNSITVPVQPPLAMSNGGSGKQAELQSQKQPSREVQVIPSQAFLMSFSSFGGNSSTSNIISSSKAQNLSSVPDMSHHGYCVAPVATSVGTSKSVDSEKRYPGQAIVFSNPYKTLDFMASPPPPSVSVGTTTATTSLAPNLKQQPHLELHKESVAASVSKASTNGLPSSVGLDLQNISPVFTKPLATCSSASQSLQCNRNLPLPPLALESPPSSGAIGTNSAGCKGGSSPPSQQTALSATTTGKESTLAESQLSDNETVMNGKKILTRSIATDQQ